MNPRSTDAQELFHQCRGPILRMAFRITGNADDAEEVLQETFLRLQQHLPRLDLSENMAGWLFRTATRIAIRLRRGRPVSLGRPDDVQSASDTDWGDVARVRKAIHDLPAPLQDLLFHRFAGDLKPGEIARRCHLPPGRIRVQIFRALALLRKTLGDFR